MKIDKRLKTRDALVMLNDYPKLFREIGDQLRVEPYDRITFGQRADLSGLETVRDLVLKPWQVIRQTSDKELLDKPFIEVFAFSYSVVSYLEAADKRDKATFNYKPSALEVQAGFNQLSGGMFTTLDRIATRMHRTHDDVLGMLDILVYSILKADYEATMYNRRLNELAQKQNKANDNN